MTCAETADCACPKCKPPESRYQSKGRPLTPYEREVIENLIEEASEVIQIACKVLRFGAGDIHPRTGESNLRHLGLETGNFTEMSRLTEALGLVTMDDVREGIKAKRERFAKYQQTEPA